MIGMNRSCCVTRTKTDIVCKPAVFIVLLTQPPIQVQLSYTKTDIGIGNHLHSLRLTLLYSLQFSASNTFSTLKTV